VKVARIRQECRAQLGIAVPAPETRSLLRWLESSGLRTFTVSQAMRGLSRKTFPTVGVLQDALDALEVSGHVRRLADAPERHGPGRPQSPVYETIRPAT